MPVQYGHPQESQREIRTLTVDLPRELAGTYDPQSKKPPIEVYGPFAKDEDVTDISEMTPRKAVDVDVEGTVAEFSFNPPLKTGRYRAVVYQSRFRAEDGDPFELTGDEGPWTGWTFQVLNAQPRHMAEPPERERRSRKSPTAVEVLLDGEPAEATGLSGEVLTVVGPEPDDVELSVRSLIPGGNAPMYERFLSRTSHEVDGNPAVSFASVGPMLEDYVWAIYHGANTVGCIPLTDQGQLLMGIPVMREPTPARFDPLIEGTPGVRTQKTDGEAAVVSNVVDDTTGAKVAYGFKRLSSTYSGPVIQARRGDGTHHPVETREFTAQDIADGDLAAWAEETGRVFLRTFYDQSSNGRSASGQFRVIATPNTVPTVATNDGLSVYEGGHGIDQPALITRTDLEAADNTAAPVSLTYTVKELPEHGQLLLTGDPVAEGEVFTQRDINTGRVAYQHDGSETTADSFQFTVSDGRGAETTWQSFPITVQPVNDAPLAPDVPLLDTDVNTTLTKDDPGLLSIVTDPEGDAVVDIRLGEPPEHGTATITEEGYYTYEPAADFVGHDPLTYVVSDGEKTAEGTIDQWVSGGPYITENTGLEVDVAAETDVTGDKLHASASGSTDAEIQFTLNEVPADGELRLGGTPLAGGDTFTQADIENGDLTYAHDGDDRPYLSFSFTVEDANGYDRSGTVNILVRLPTQNPTAYDNHYEVAEDTTLEVDAPGLLANAADPDGYDETILDTDPVEGPANGTLTLDEDGSFTYVPAENFNGTDSFTYAVTDGRGGRAEATARIGINSVNDTPTITKNIGLVVRPGESGVITDQRLDVADPEDVATDLFYTIDEQPEHGTIYNDDIPLEEGDIFSHDDVETGLLTYRHDGDESPVSDSFSFTVTDQGGSRNAVQPSLGLQPEILNPGGDPVLRVRGDDVLETSIGASLSDYTAIAAGGTEETAREPSLFEIGSSTEWEQVGIDKDGAAFFGDLDFYNDRVVYSPAGSRPMNVHAIRHSGDTLTAELATSETATVADVETPVTERDNLVLGRRANNDGDVRLRTFVLWSKALSDQKTASRMTAPQNLYTEYSPLVTPQKRAASLQQYDGASTAWPKEIYDTTVTPDRNPRLFEDAVYVGETHETGWSPIEERYGVFDLPLQSELVVRVNGQERWRGQTRLLPTLIEPRMAELELGWDISSRAARQEAMRRIWKASMEALRLWGCSLPRNGKPTPSMVEFVLTRLANPVDRSSGVQGDATSKLGDQMTRAKSDRASERRLANLGELLRNCEETVPLDINEQLPMKGVGVASNASPEYYPHHGSRNLMKKIAPLYDPTQLQHIEPYRSEHHRLDL